MLHFLIDCACRNANKQWMLGEAVLVSPVITPHTSSLTAYFTAGAWYSAWDYSRMDMPQGGPVKLHVPVGDIAIHYRGGTIIPMQQYAPVTKDVRLSPVTLVIALPAQPSNGRVAGPGPVQPYALEQTCATAHARNPGQLVSCGFLFMDGGDDITVSADNSVQVCCSGWAEEGEMWSGSRSRSRGRCMCGAWCAVEKEL